MSIAQAQPNTARTTERVVRLLVMVALALFSAWTILGEYPRVLGEHGLWDFGAFVASGRAAAEGLSPYGIYPPLTPHVVFPGFEAWNPNLNPPISALLFQLFDLAPLDVSFRVWMWISIGLYAIAVLLLVLRFARSLEGVVIALWAFALAGFWDTVYLGQIYTPLVLATVGAWLLLERGQAVWAGILIGIVVAMKPNFLVWPVLLFLAGYRVPTLVCIATAAIISAIPLFAFGPGIYVEWLKLVASDSERAIFLTNGSFAGFAARIGMPILGTVLSAALLLGLAAWAFWRRPTAMRASAFGLLAALLASPLGWIHYTLFLLPVLLAYWDRKLIWVVAAILVVPVTFIIGQFGKEASVQVTVGSLYGWGLVLCLLVLLFEEWKSRASAPASLRA